MAEYKGKVRVKIISTNTTINDTDFSGWVAINTGTGAVEVNKVTLQPSEGLDFSQLQPNVHWDSPIQIVILEDGGQVTLHQLIYKEIKQR